MEPLELVRLARRYQAAHLRISDAVVAAIAMRWKLTRPLNDDELSTFAGSAAATVAAGQAQTARLAERYIDSTVADLPGFAPAGLDTASMIDGLRGGVPLVEVYARPVITARRVISEGRSFLDAMSVGEDRLRRTGYTDLQLASRQATNDTMASHPRIVGYRRVTDGNACSLCLTASTQRYHVGDLLPIHSRCGCTVVPIVGEKDPGLVIDRELLDRLKRDGTAADLSYSKAIGRLQEQSRNARGRASAARAEALTEPDPARARRLQKRAAEWDRKSDRYRIEAGRERAARDASRKRRAAPPAERFDREVKVVEHGELGPTLERRTAA